MVQIDQKNNVVAETGNTVHSGHFNDEREEVVDEGVDESRERRREERQVRG